MALAAESAAPRAVFCDSGVSATASVLFRDCQHLLVKGFHVGIALGDIRADGRKEVMHLLALIRREADDLAPALLPLLRLLDIFLNSGLDEPRLKLAALLDHDRAQ